MYQGCPGGIVRLMGRHMGGHEAPQTGAGTGACLCYGVITSEAATSPTMPSDFAEILSIVSASVWW